ncbi:MAG: twin-arginine translocase subunit TatC [Patescibacteria group bacterium]
MDELRKKLKEYSPYFEDLFKRIYFLTIFFVVFFVIGFFLSAPIIKLSARIFDFNDVVLAATSPFQLVNLAMNAGVFFAMILSIPIFLYHFYAFIGTGLKKGEKKIFFFLLPIGLFLFLLGFAYSFFILYFTMQTLANINMSLGIKNLWDISAFLSQIISTSAMLGFIFEFPIIITLLIKAGFVSINFLRQKRRFVILAMFITTSLLPPTDGISLLVMVLPLIVMYEITIMYNSLGHKQLT